MTAHETGFCFSRTGIAGARHGPGAGRGFPPARDLFEEVDDALSQHLSRLMFEGPESELTLTENAQPALLAASLAVDPRARKRRPDSISAGRPPMSPGIRSANIRRWRRRAPCRSAMRRGSSSAAAGRCRRRCRSARVRWRRCSASTSPPRARSPRRRPTARSAPSPTTTARGRSSSAVIARRSSAPSRWPPSRGRGARSCCRSARRFIRR